MPRPIEEGQFNTTRSLVSLEGSDAGYGKRREMNLNSRGMPSPAMIVAVLGLTVALGTTAIAAPDGANKISRSKTKQIARKQANKVVDQRAPSLRVAHANTAGHADTA